MVHTNKCCCCVDLRVGCITIGIVAVIIDIILLLFSFAAVSSLPIPGLIAIPLSVVGGAGLIFAAILAPVCLFLKPRICPQCNGLYYNLPFINHIKL